MLILRKDFLNKLNISSLKDYKHKIGQKVDTIKLEKEFQTHYPEYNNLCDCGNEISFSCKIDGFISGKRTYYIGYAISCPKCSKRGVTLEKMIKKYGHEDGSYRWNQYCNRQSETNTLKYKQEKYGWTKKEFEEYNKKRSVTKENQIALYGIEDGTRKYNDYVEKQRHAGCTLDYFIEKYGPTDGKLKYEEINKLKSHTLKSYIERYGEEGYRLYDEFRKKCSVMFVSKVSQELFDSIIKEIGDNGHTYYGKLNKEYFRYDKQLDRCYFYDYVDTIRKKVIEFNGTCFHARSEDDPLYKNPFSNITAKESYQKDSDKKRCIEQDGYSILYIWENEYYLDKNKEIEKCISFLKGTTSDNK
jgi:hypothetical protein